MLFLLEEMKMSSSATANMRHIKALNQKTKMEEKTFRNNCFPQKYMLFPGIVMCYVRSVSEFLDSEAMSE